MTFPPHPASGLAENLARQAEAVCRHYLANGRKQGRYWLAGNVSGVPGHSLYVRLAGPGSGKGAAGKWTDAATGEHGDLLDLVRLARGLSSLREAMDEARAFLRLPAPEPAFAPVRGTRRRQDRRHRSPPGVCSKSRCRSRAPSRKTISAIAASPARPAIFPPCASTPAAPIARMARRPEPSPRWSLPSPVRAAK